MELSCNIVMFGSLADVGNRRIESKRKLCLIERNNKEIQNLKFQKQAMS